MNNYLLPEAEVNRKHCQLTKEKLHLIMGEEKQQGTPISEQIKNYPLPETKACKNLAKENYLCNMPGKN